MKTHSQKFEDGGWDMIPAKFLDEISSKYDDELPRMSFQNFYRNNTKKE